MFKECIMWVSRLHRDIWNTDLLHPLQTLLGLSWVKTSLNLWTMQMNINAHSVILNLDISNANPGISNPNIWEAWIWICHYFIENESDPAFWALNPNPSKKSWILIRQSESRFRFAHHCTEHSGSAKLLYDIFPYFVSVTYIYFRHQKLFISHCYCLFAMFWMGIFVKFAS